MESEDIQRIRQEHKRLFTDEQHSLQTDIINGASRPRKMASHQVDHTEDAVAARSLATEIFTLNCSGCESRIQIETTEIVRLFKDEADEFYGFCVICGTVTCLGCCKRLTTATEKFGNTTSDGRHFMWHCDDARLALIWALLSGYDHQVNHNKQSTKFGNTSLKKPTTKRSGIAGIGYSHSYDMDDTFISINGNDTVNAVGQQQVQEDGGWVGFTNFDEAVAGLIGTGYKRAPGPICVDLDDQPTAKVMAALAAILPCPSNHLIPTIFDSNPPEVLTSLIERSSILDKAAELLRNNSLDDATKRFGLYDSLFSFVRALATGPIETAALLHKPRTINKAGHDLLKVSLGLPTRLHDESTETARSLFRCATDLINQSEKLLQRAAIYQEEFRTEDTQRMLMLCTNIKDCADLCNGFRASDKSNISDKQPEEDPHAWQDGIQVLAVPDDQIFSQHHYAIEARSFTEGPRGRMAKLINEIGMLEGGLARNIFVRYGESRMDVMKIVIVGPRGTPYEHGLFEFDLLFPLAYPQKSPQMYFKTTGGGRVLFNPNLYANGKVCLSLLGTWQGEQWEPGKSTLLQVLHSIQAMIFCEEPWCNEPGRETMQKTDASKRFNRSLYESTVKYAMLEWLEGKKSPPPPPPPKRRRDLDWNGSTHDYVKYVPPYEPEATSSTTDVEVFADVAKSHFENNRINVINTVKEWIKEKKPYGTAEAAKKADLLPEDVSLKEYLTAALQHLGGIEVGYGMTPAGLVGSAPW